MHDFTENLLTIFLSRSDDLEKQRFLTAQREIMIEILSEKYEYGPFAAAVLLLSSASELLKIVRQHHAGCPECPDSHSTED